MILKSLKLENIRSYLVQEIEFPSGSILLNGDIGAGKSTILLAIEFALFGTKRKHLPASALLRNGKNKGAVELKLTIDNKEVIIRRTLKRTHDTVKQDLGFVIINGIKTDATPIELKSKILDLLGYSQQLVTKSKDLVYRYTVYTPQEDMKQILTDDKENRIDTLRHVFNIDKYKRIKENTSIYIKELKDKIKINTALISDLDVKTKQKTEINLDITKLKTEISDLRPRLDQIKLEVKEKQNNLKEIEEKIKTLNDIKKNIELNELRLKEGVSKRQDNNKKIEETNKDIEELKYKIDYLNITTNFSEKDFEESIKNLEKEIGTIDTDKQKLSEELKIKKVMIESLQQELENKKELEEKLNTNQEMHDTLLTQVKEKLKLKEILNESELNLAKVNDDLKENQIKREHCHHIKTKITDLSKCPTCFQEVSENYKDNITKTEDEKIKNHDGLLTNLTQSKKELEENLTKTKLEFEDINQKENKLEVLKVDLNNQKELLINLSKKQESHSNLLKENDKLNNKLSNLKETKNMKKELDIKREELKIIRERDLFLSILNENKRKSEELLAEQDEIKKSIGQVNTNLMDLRQKAESYKEIGDNFKTTKLQLEELIKKEKISEIRNAELEQELETTNKILVTLNNELKEKNEIKDSIKKTKERVQWLDEFFINLITTIEKHIMLKLHGEFNQVFQQWFNILIEDETTNIRLDEEFTPIIEQNGYEINIDHLSGGEKTSCALSYRLALNKVINDFVVNIKTKDLIILDEPTDGFSNEQLDKIRDVLEQLDMKQVIIVSHESKIESFVDNVIKISKEGHVSQIMA